MALIDKASLLMVPSTYEAGTLYNVLPSGNRAPDSTDQNSGYDQTRADFTFDRGSNAAATRVNADGLIEKYRENLLTYSNQFDTTWVNANSSETSGQADKDGGTDAWKIDLTGVSGRIYQSKSQSGVVTFSVYAKKGTLDWVILSSNIVDASFNLATGEKGTLVAGIASSIEDVGGGWYRCSCTGNGAFTQFRVYPAIADNTFTGTSGNIYIQDAQAETGLVATDYLDSGATTAKAGVLIDLPRINYDANGENGALLLEPQRANLIVNSEALSIGTSGSSVEQNTSETTSPEGFYNATKVLGSTNYLAKGVGSAFSGNNTTSVFLKKGNDSTIGVYMYDGAYYRANFNLESGTIESEVNGATATIENYGNGWYRCSIYKQTPANVVEVGIDGIVGYCYTYGWQHEYNASYPTSYIPNHGESGGVTRAADSMEATHDADLFTSGEGVVFMEFEIDDVTISGYPQLFRIENPSDTNDKFWGYIFEDSDSGEINFGYRLDENAVKKSEGSFTVDTTTTAKIAMRLDNNNYAAYYNGTKDVPTQYAGVVNDLTKIVFSSTPYPVGVSLKQVAVFNEALSDSELATLTTL